MSGFLEKLRGADFTGLNRAFGKGKHSPKIPSIGGVAYESRGVSGGPLSSQDSPESRSGRGFGRIGGAQNGNSASSLLDDEDTSPTQIALRGLTIFFLSINLFIYIAIAAFQKKWDVGPSGLTGLAIFVLIQGLLHALVFLLVPQIYERTDMLRGFARAIRLTRIQFIVYGTQSGLALVLSLIATISAYTGGCKNSQADPNASNTDYISHIGGFCRNKRAAAAFWWFSFLCFGLSLGIVFKSWYSIRKLGPRHPAFEPPQGVGVRTVDGDEDDDFRADEPYDRSPPQFPQEMTAVRTSNVGGYYGERPIFDSDRVPAGYAAPSGNAHQVDHTRSPPQMAAYKDPFDEIRAQIYQNGR
ncbi:hypothetical protein MJO28_000005 [Puccinia striiformis f. sp. tritici]|uniref:MARVEL domain-containing protein n=4 Tax=Puccinia striiformis TaxID=27350 RepID=A0A0L0V593_9BASI|nr:hypothetical protein Pst134EB_002404 [Puccinia striiformis f. sp. tritici]KAI9628078.1 hypothetical protein H4Q26_018226 [Puccinia striiformis f. sp. tritici PST-130]KNE94447.1 hypothetical protein PSTG_12240 [Puccinia striiformis f. sp. tritici PST-78]POV99652.1 hypothetical protein PSTT_13665 [Puccinia striiformis]KAI7961911.1 hypothetical protein MJO28_000005 [Puccinia striiformis f. sp. tritici]